MKKLSGLALTLCFVLGAFTFSTPSQAQEQKKLRVSLIPIIDAAPLVIAKQRGFFNEEGLAVDTTPTNGGAVGIPALIGGAVDIALGNSVTTMLAVSQGLEVVVVAPSSQLVDSPTVSTMIGRKADSYQTPADFVGKIIGVNTRNGINWLYAKAWIQKRGGDPDKVVFKEVPFPQIADAIKRRQIDASITGEPFKSAFLKDPELAIVGSPFVEVQPGLDVGQYVATAAFAKQNPDVIARFAKALRKGIAWYNSNLGTQELAEAVAEFTKLPVATIREMRLTPLPMTSSLPQIQKTVELMRSQGLLTADLDASKYILPISLKE